ncbi:hypothetical protein [Chthonobacter albigriseus]|uniref:hypothetical protein n=1 Tax=Chthonobacter albigriseus TaxID=1683161 RepID=UPI0015EF4C1A|nr:hypothetical protein [Chthonobacter albigriseus]
MFTPGPMDQTIGLLPALILAAIVFAGTVASAIAVGVLRLSKPNSGPVHMMDHEDPLGAIRMLEIVMLGVWLAVAVHLYGPLVTGILGLVALECLNTRTASELLTRHVARIGLGRFARVTLIASALLAVAAMATYGLFSVR